MTTTRDWRRRQRDPAWAGRVFWLLWPRCVILWPLLVLTEFKPWLLASTRESLKPTLPLSRGLRAAAHRRPDFLWLVARETWRTVAIATAGLALALVIALPLTLLVGARAVGLGRWRAAWPRGRLRMRWAVRGLLVVLRSVPELVWALVFVRVVGLGPDGRRAGHRAHLRRHAGQGVRRDPGKRRRARDASRCCAMARAGCRPSSTACCRNARASSLSYTVYRWECAIRSSAVLGFVGAGGLGQQLDIVDEDVHRRRGQHDAAGVRRAGRR